MSAPGVTFVVVPRAGGEGWYWHRVTPSTRPPATGSWSSTCRRVMRTPALAAYADAIVAASGDALDVVLVAQSMGAFSAPPAADRLGVRRIVLVNAIVPSPGEGTWKHRHGLVAGMSISR